LATFLTPSLAKRKVCEDAKEGSQNFIAFPLWKTKIPSCPKSLHQGSGTKPMKDGYLIFKIPMGQGFWKNKLKVMCVQVLCLFLVSESPRASF